MRYAIYYTPPRDNDLTMTAARWLGRDAFSGLSLPAAGVDGLAAGAQSYYTAAPRRYGFHGTLKAPFRLVDTASERDLIDAIRSFCRGVDPVDVRPTEIARLGGFFALVPARENGRLNDLANRIVTTFDKFRAPLSDTEMERRQPERLSRVELRNLYNWGYPYVFETFRFHMTLTGHVEEHERDRVEAALHRHFGNLPEAGISMDRLTLFVEREAGAPFVVHSTHMFERSAIREIA